MSQERTRFPIQPSQVRRSAQSNKDMAVPGSPARGGKKGAARRDQDKPIGPPPRRRKDADGDPPR